MSVLNSGTQAAAPAHGNTSNEKEIMEHVEKGDMDLHVHDEKHDTTNADALAAENAEKQLGVMDSLRMYPAAVAWSVGISLCIIMEGMDLGLIGNVIAVEPFRRRYGNFINEESGYQLTPSWQFAVNQASTFGCFVGIFIAGWAQDRFGYRRTLQVALVSLTCFIFLVFFAQSIEMLFVGQFLSGIPFGLFSSSAVSYASDITPISLRGYLTTYVNGCWVLGQVLAAGIFVGVGTRDDQWAYRIPFALQWVWPVPIFIIVTLAPESPWHLVRKGKFEEAKKVIQRLSTRAASRNADGTTGHQVDADQTLAMMVRTNELEKHLQSGTSYLDCLKGTDLRRTEIGCMAWASQIILGSSFSNQPTYFFQQAGLPAASTFQLSLGVTLIALVGTICSWFVMTHVGRRKIYVVGAAGCVIINLCIGALSVAADKTGNKGLQWGQAAFVMLWVLTADLSIFPIAYAIVGESSSTRLRSKSVGLARNFYNVFSIVSNVLNTYQMNPSAWNWRGKAGFFWAGAGFLSFLWAYFRLPEMKGRSYRELDILFERKVSARKFSKTEVSDEE